MGRRGASDQGAAPARDPRPWPPGPAGAQWTAMEPAFFVSDGPRLVPTEYVRGPWSRDHQHGGPPAGLVGRAVEAALAGDGFAVARLTFDLLRPVPIVPLEVEVERTAGGRTAARLAATVRADGEVVIRATALALAPAAVPIPEAGREAPPPAPETAAPFVFPFFDDEPAYHRAMDVRLVRGVYGAGPTFSWLRMRVPLVLGEAPSPLVRVLVAADSGNGMSPVLDPKRFTFVNPDLTVHLHRPPAGEWVGLEARTTPEASGVGLADTRLWDLGGPVGRSAQSLVLRAR